MSEQQNTSNEVEEKNEETIFELKIEKVGDKAAGHVKIRGNHGDLVNMIASVLESHEESLGVLSDAVAALSLHKLFGEEKEEAA